MDVDDDDELEGDCAGMFPEVEEGEQEPEEPACVLCGRVKAQHGDPAA